VRPENAYVLGNHEEKRGGYIMKPSKTVFVCIVVCLMVAGFLPLAGLAFEPVPESYTPPHPKTYVPTLADLYAHKKQYDDPRPFMKTFGPKQVLPPELYEKLCYDVEEMKDKWAEVVGFRSPDIVGKIAPDIKPGSYSCKDKESYPGLKELMWPDLYNRFSPSAPPHAGNIPEFELVPTQQYYWALPIAEATDRNSGKTKLDDSGYIVWETWEGGYPFPRPSWEFKAQQIMYNIEKRYMGWGLNYFLFDWIEGYTKDLKLDFSGYAEITHVRLAGRCLLPPYGFFDERARERGEFKTYIFGFFSPRDIAGAAQKPIYYLDPEKTDQTMMYIPSLRRIRKMSATDTQDPIFGQDIIYDDTEGFQQKLSPTRYPYTYKVVGEKEFLLPAHTEDGTDYMSTEGVEFRNMKFERRPMYVLELTQLDPNYVYSRRIFRVDRETFLYYSIENYDQKGRLYRTYDVTYGWFPEMGMIATGGLLLARDHIDLHSGIQQPHMLPAFWNRNDVSLRGLVKKAK
jgi:hypothetical protein